MKFPLDPSHFEVPLSLATCIMGAAVSALGLVVATAAGSVSGSRSLGFLASGAGSKIYVGGVLKTTANAGTNSLPAASRIGSAGVASTSWFIEAGSSISEFIVFNGDPTGLAGWGAFVTAASAYYA